jgi:predicted LPLAT superfamily acyltransferase
MPAMSGKQSTINNQQWKGVTGGNTWGQKGLLLLFHLFNVTVLYAALALIVPFYMLFRRQGYLSVYRYFRKHFHYPPLKSFCKTYRNHFVFGQCLLDRFAVYAGRRNLFVMNITGNEHFEKLIAGDEGFIIAGSHVGNFELSGYLLQQDRKHINGLVYGGESKEIMENRAKILHQNNISMIPVMEDLSHIFTISDVLAKGEIVSMPCDRNLGSAKSATCDFLGGKADFPLGAFMLAVQFNVPVLAIFVMKKSISRYHVYVRPICIDAAETPKREKAGKYAAAFAKELEIIVRLYPEQWFNYYSFWKE